MARIRIIPALALVAALPAVASSYPQLQEVYTVDSANQDKVGGRVALSGNGRTMLVSAHLDDDNGSKSGSAYVFIFDHATQSWLQRAKLVPPDGAAEDWFGWDVALSTDGSTAVIGAPKDDDNGDVSGSAYVYERGSGWQNTTTYSLKLHPSDAFGLEYFGHAVDVSNDGSTVIVSAPWDHDVGFQRGSAYVYERAAGGWSAGATESKLTPSDAVDQDYFGEDVAISGDASTVVVGAMHDDNFGNNSGSAYVFERGAGWTTTNVFTARLDAADAAPNDNFGNQVDVNGDGSTLVVASYRDDDSGWNAGSLYVYDRPALGWATTSTWTAKLIAWDNQGTNGWMGRDVAISANGSTIATGAPGHIHGGPINGLVSAIYVFEEPAGGWVGTTVPDHELLAPDNNYASCMGEGVAISANRTFIAGGNWCDGDVPPPVLANLNSGSVYMFGPSGGLGPSQIMNPDLNGDGMPDGIGSIVVTSPPSRPWTLVGINRGAIFGLAGEPITEIVVGTGDPPAGTLYFTEDPPGTYTVEFDTPGGYDLVFSDGHEQLRLATLPPLPPGTDGGPMTVESIGPELLLSWDASCSTATEHMIVFGSQFPDGFYEPFAPDGTVCGVGDPPYAWVGAPDPLPGELLWWLVVATDGDTLEGPWGPNSTGSERSGVSSGCGTTDKALDDECGRR